MRTVAELRAWVGREAYDPFGRRVGVVAGLRADRATGAPEWLVVALGGDGRDLRAVPMVGSEPSGFAVRVTPSVDRVASSPGLPAEDDLTVERFKTIFTRLNARVPGLTPDGIRVRLAPGGWLEEVWLCLDRRLAQDACPADQRGDAADRQRIRIWRGDPRP